MKKGEINKYRIFNFLKKRKRFIYIKKKTYLCTDKNQYILNMDTKVKITAMACGMFLAVALLLTPAQAGKKTSTNT